MTGQPKLPCPRLLAARNSTILGQSANPDYDKPAKSDFPVRMFGVTDPAADNSESPGDRFSCD
jgi:hypothetical protein